MTLRRCDFASFTPESQSPPKWGAPGGINVQVIPISSAALGIDCFPNFLVRFIWSCLSLFLVPIKFTPLSEYILAGATRLARNRLKAAVQDWEDKSDVSSKCMVFVVKQTNKSDFDFDSCLPFSVTKGPANSIPLWVNGGEGFIRSLGRSPINGGFDRWHLTQFRMRWRIAACASTIQKIRRSSARIVFAGAWKYFRWMSCRMSLASQLFLGITIVLASEGRCVYSSKKLDDRNCHLLGASAFDEQKIKHSTKHECTSVDC